MIGSVVKLRCISFLLLSSSGLHFSAHFLEEATGNGVILLIRINPSCVSKAGRAVICHGLRPWEHQEQFLDC